jgi:hypothetical protein
VATDAKSLLHESSLVEGRAGAALAPRIVRAAELNLVTLMFPKALLQQRRRRGMSDYRASGSPMMNAAKYAIKWTTGARRQKKRHGRHAAQGSRLTPAGAPST